VVSNKDTDAAQAKRPAAQVTGDVARRRDQHSAESAHGGRAPPRLLAKGEVLERTGLSFPTIWGMMRRNAFPRARTVGARPYWIQSEVDDWISNLPIRRYKTGE